MALRFVVCAAAFLCVGQSSLTAGMVYFNDFETNTAGFSAGSQQSLPTAGGGSSNYLGYFSVTSRSSTLTVNGLISGMTYNLTFDLFTGDTLDGSDPANGPDRFSVTIGGTSVLDATFSNSMALQQTYSDATPLGGSLVTGQTGADAIVPSNDPNWMSAIYYFDGVAGNPLFSFVATGTSETIVFAANGGGQQAASDEFFAIDNVAVSSVPEPSSMVLFGLAMVGGIGLRFRQRRGEEARQRKESGVQGRTA